MLGLFGSKKRHDRLRGDVQDSFENVKKDFTKVGEWIKHLDDKNSGHGEDIGDIKTQLSAIHNDLMELKDFISFFGPQLNSVLSKQTETNVNKQPMIGSVQTPSQPNVQTTVLDGLTVMERAIVWALLNSEMNLSYEDLAALLGKDKSTIRGQINTIKQKSDGLIQESVEFNGKKRLFIPDEVKSSIIKSVKVRVKSEKRGKGEK